MPLASTTAKNAALDACYGSSRSTVWPATITVHLYRADPRFGGLELGTNGGYVAVSRPNDNTTWQAAANGTKTNVAGTIVFGPSTGAWSHPATHWVIRNGATLLDVGLLATPITVTDAGRAHAINITITELDPEDM